ncbi:transglutaminase family protein [Hydrogenothermus marinus]|uniref:Transglutaminase superfamily protein n=1 Tax=Hydrogenothermus marinus TaxID=133270 RepID=A0A3M0BMH3_9AQUI|nr:transglutaminaseTgpA domain-containing protein [Hydrogenothermus marinus]RMA97674.1 transglutaminase superfamily protein [Hydrogenothermus marinus]
MYSIKDIVNIFSYIASIIAFLSVMNFINPIYSIIFALFLGLSFYFEKKQKFPIKRVFLNILSIAIVLFSALQVSLENPVVPIVEALTVLLGIKLIEQKKFRDYMQIFLISVFLLAGRALLSIDITFLIYFLLLFFIVSVGIIFLTFYSQEENIYFTKNQFFSLLIKLLAIPLISIPATIFLFVILPRTDYPLLNFLNKSSSGITGFSDKVSLGDVSDIQEDNSIIFRVKMPKLNKEIYFRGITLDYFDGKTWHRRYKKPIKIFSISGEKFKSVVFLNPYGQNYLFGLNYPIRVYGVDNILYSDFTFKSRKTINKTIKYEVYSILKPKIKQTLENKYIYLQIPKNINPNIIKLAKRLRENKSVPEFIKNLKTFFRDFKYSLKNLPTGDDALYKFLFKTKSGNCEYFASATAILLRLNNIPARVVIGYKGGDYNDFGGYYAVFNKNAHSWVEYYYNGYWNTLDTTPSALPLELQKKELSFLFKLRLMFDTINYYYINFVIDFNFQKQVHLFKSVSKNISDIKSQIYLIIGFFKENIIYILLSGLISFVGVVLFRYYSIPIEERILNKFLKKLEKYGYLKKENEGLEEFINKIKEEDLKEKANTFVKEFESIYYKDKKLNKEEKTKLENLIKRI